MYRNANIHNGFSFRGEQIKLVKVFDNNDEWDPNCMILMVFLLNLH